jgi:hypothetical protein
MRWTEENFATLSRTELALTLCENLPWQALNGQLRVNGCLELLEQLAADGLLQPVRRSYRPARCRRSLYRSASWRPVSIRCGR